MNHYACVFHLPLTEFENLEKIVLEYDVGEYLIGHEVEPYSHYHLVLQLPCKKQWAAFQKKVIERYDLRGKPAKGKPRQYGAIKQIKDLERLKAYTVKQKNVKTNMSQADYLKYLEISFSQKKNRQFYERIMNHLETIDDLLVLKTQIIKHKLGETHTRETSVFPKIQRAILLFCIAENHVVTASQVKSWSYSYVQFSTKITPAEKVEILMEKLKY